MIGTVCHRNDDNNVLKREKKRHMEKQEVKQKPNDTFYDIQTNVVDVGANGEKKTPESNNIQSDTLCSIVAHNLPRSLSLEYQYILVTYR